MVADYERRVPRAFQETVCRTNVEWNEEGRCIVPFNFGPELPDFLVEWKAPKVYM